MNATPIRVLIVADPPVFAEALASGLRAEGMSVVVGTARTGEEVIALLERDDTQVLLMDLNLPGDMPTLLLTGPEVLQRRPDMKMLLVSSVDDWRDAGLAEQAGFHGYVTKDAPIDRIRRAIEAVMDGEVWFHPPPTAQPSIIDAAHLTPMELEVLGLLVEGADGRTIATRLELRRDEVREHVGSILKKLNVHPRLEAATLWLQQDPSAAHPHLDPMIGEQLLTHLRSLHPRGIAPHHPLDVDSLEELHVVLHRQIPPSPA